MPSPIARFVLAAAFGLSLQAIPAHAGEEPSQCTYVQVAKLPIRYVGSGLAPAVDGIIDGTAATMLVDTGADTTYLTLTGTGKRGLLLRSTGRYVEGVSGSSRLYSARLKEFSIGSARAGKRTELHVIGETSYTPSYDAIVGASFLLQADMEISLSDKELMFFRQRGCEGSSLAYWKEEAVALPFASTFSSSPNPHFTVIVNGKKMDAIIDTGAERSVIGLDAAKRAGVRTDAPGVKRLADVLGVGTSRVPRWSAVFETLSIGGETIQGAEIGIIDSQGSNSADLYLGQDFLRTHRVLFAMSQQKLYLAYLGGNPFVQRTGIEPWMQQEADSGNGDAQFLLARMYQFGSGVAKDAAQSNAWLDKAAAQGHPQANLVVGRKLVRSGRYPEAAARLRAALDKLPAERYGALWLYLARVRNGEADLGKRELDTGSASHRDDAWPAPISDFYRGRTDAAALLKQAGEEAGKKQRTCEATAYIAEWHAAHGDKETARSLIAAARPNCAPPRPGDSGAAP
jgi:predicted aspartyl protease